MTIYKNFLANLALVFASLFFSAALLFAASEIDVTTRRPSFSWPGFYSPRSTGQFIRQSQYESVENWLIS
ncbi:MAG TPA: hypothetical protein VEK84_02900 [Terriglobales bacterium]|nr:hypothetical protein [Terriglobales bacterium]